ncbi:MAG: T9SS type A sorting domain-containing protein, partial [Bacteroidetes bacterium]|nr:T9SS type A sorting domain-containing protein [Bacteroidota bacterium]
GETVALLVDEIKEAGVHTINFNASDLNSGIYFYKLEADNFVKIRKMSLIK